MPAFINTSIISATSFSSTELGVLATIAHAMDAEGKFSLRVIQGDIVIGQTRLTISAGAATDNVTLDLATLRASSRKALRSEYELRKGGYVVFFVSQGEGRYRVVISDETVGRAYQKAAARGDVVFDSAQLRGGDVYVVTLVRPGLYDMEMVSTEGGARGELTVSYPVVGREPYVASEPLTIECEKSALRPAAASIGPGQGAIFRLAVPASITVRLRSPDDREKRQEPVYRGVKPEAARRTESSGELPRRRKQTPETKAAGKPGGKPRKGR
jgi:hypothetical protein